MKRNDVPSHILYRGGVLLGSAVASSPRHGVSDRVSTVEVWRTAMKGIIDEVVDGIKADWGDNAFISTGHDLMATDEISIYSAMTPEDEAVAAQEAEIEAKREIAQLEALARKHGLTVMKTMQ